MNNRRDEILSYREMCDVENKQTLQRGMNFRLNHSYCQVPLFSRTLSKYFCLN